MIDAREARNNNRLHRLDLGSCKQCDFAASAKRSEIEKLLIATKLDEQMNAFEQWADGLRAGHRQVSV